MRVYIGYPDSCSPEGRFRIKDLFVDELNIDYSTLPVEVKRKLLALLENLDRRSYMFMGEVVYDAIDVLEFALFSLSVREFKEVVLPGYLYGKPTFIIRSLFEGSFGVTPQFFYDFNFFDSDALIVNVGYSRSSLAVGGELVVSIPVGEFHFVDLLGNYLFNRFTFEMDVSNTWLRKSGKRGELLDKFRTEAARLLFKDRTYVEIDEFNYRRSISREEVTQVLSPLTGSMVYGDYVKGPFDISSSIVYLLYLFEEMFRFRPSVRKVFLLGRLTFPFENVISRIFPLKVVKVSPEELLDRPIGNICSRVNFRRFDFPSGKRGALENFQVGNLSADVSLESLRKYFNDRDLRGVRVIEMLAQEEFGEEMLERFIYELLFIVKRSSFRKREDILYLNSAIAALSKLSVPKHLLPKVVEELEKKAFNWLFPLETKLNILYFCYRYRDEIGDSSLKLYPPLLLSYIRDKKLTEGEKNFVRTAAAAIFFQT